MTSTYTPWVSKYTTIVLTELERKTLFSLLEENCAHLYKPGDDEAYQILKGIQDKLEREISD